MLDLLFMLLIVGGLVVFGWGICLALGQIATHMRGNPDAVKAIVEHVFMPLFGVKKEPDRKSPPGTALVKSDPSEEPTTRNYLADSK
jgi:hypothetical protein